METVGGTYITEPNPGMDKLPDEPDIDAPDSDNEQEQNQKIFNVDEAVPPTDYEAPYSSMPANVQLSRVKQQVKGCYNKLAKQKQSLLKEKLEKARAKAEEHANYVKQTQGRGKSVGKRGSRTADNFLPPIGRTTQSSVARAN